ncbi:MAG TPA: GNAT family N-acetyltransferase [Synergistaceae bacterium]|nr:GNAT family N-acetyltransferase [Synergistaceae bacterium]HPJ25907.1 GNAT family N-acetyltransferase [Synergistaceae bacterium]HPQ36902.1 GNAT family N-acetyltransferase [Synergistaceae bacterium]
MQTGNSEYTLRKTTMEDVPKILEFILELAEYEGLRNEVEATEELLRTHLFEKTNPAAEVVFACYKGEPVGFALFCRIFSTFTGCPGIYLDDLYVRPSMRRKGLGTALFAYLAKRVLEEGGARLEWRVLDWNTEALGFYHSLGAETLEHQLVNRLTGKSLQRMAKHLP